MVKADNDSGTRFPDAAVGTRGVGRTIESKGPHNVARSVLLHWLVKLVSSYKLCMTTDKDRESGDSGNARPTIESFQ